MADTGVGRMLEQSQRTLPIGRRFRLVAIAVVATLVAGGLLWSWVIFQQRRDAALEALGGDARDAAAAADRFLGDRLELLAALADSPTVRSGDPTAMLPLLEAASRPDLALGGGIGWVDAQGLLQVEAGAPDGALPIDLSDRDYVRQGLAFGEAQVSGGIIGRLSGEPLVVLATPSRDAAGAPSGLLLASVPVASLAEVIPASDGPDTGLMVIDAQGLVLYDSSGLVLVPAGLTPPPAPGGPAVVGPGVHGEPDHAVAWGSVPTGGWNVALDVPTATLLDDAREQFVAEAASLVVLGVAAAALVLLVGRRVAASQREAARSARGLATVEAFAESLSAASDRRSVGRAAGAAMGRALGTSAVVVGVVDEGRRRVEFVATGDVDPELVERYRDLPLTSRTAISDAVRLGTILDLPLDEYARRYPTTAPDLERQGIRRSVTTPFDAPGIRGVVSIGLLDPRPLEPSEWELLDAMLALLGQALARASSYDAQRAAAHAFQEALRPSTALGDGLPLQYAVRYLSAHAPYEIGGDWIDVFRLSPTRVGAVIGDVVGHGVEAAAVMGQLRSAFRAIATLVPNPADALAELDRQSTRIPGSLATTMAYVVVDFDTETVTLAGAGHPPAAVASRDAGARLVETTALPIGIAEHGAARPTAVLRLRAEDTLVLYTDGLVERRGEVLDLGLDRLLGTLGAHGARPVEQLADNLLGLADQGASLDDVALVCLRFASRPARTFSARVPADPNRLAELRRELRSWSRSLGLDTTVVDDLLLVTGELAANATMHAYRDAPAGDVVVEVEPSDAELLVTVSDNGRWVGLQDGDVGGRGLAIVHHLAASVSVERSALGTSVRVTMDAGHPKDPALVSG